MQSWSLQVYDVIRFMDKHPGGNEVLLAATGKDATNDFEDIGHSALAGDTMIMHCISEVDSSTVPAKHNSVPPQQTYNADKGSDFVIKILQFLVPISISGLAFTVQQTLHQSRFRHFLIL
ncbi:Cytochrome b5-like Heme/Steroid binding domain [Musa troglodytarum]|uniref:Cytochrome b5-like Heme/Steroid binding domain n=1 Tax=Musa troglodytarum TaxID=320322 RepID=A0A9E7JZS9_9LILI|nr:Cytochrome b5-like Heme/Steroid binding domain [Musa troglodytarum]URD98281.1 Cytochrome b5-like Heme/Steroid binding domain [Musa troglodytarum]URD98282.1 Cytochrome b5-like Heme/Steroid binding domain [Musa troglodytarum]